LTIRIPTSGDAIEPLQGSAFERQKFIIGKDDGCEIILAYPSISRRHWTLIVEGEGTYSLSDMGSYNGLFLMKVGAWVRIKEEKVTPTDMVRIGSSSAFCTHSMRQA